MESLTSFFLFLLFKNCKKIKSKGALQKGQEDKEEEGGGS
jgi:hypothetical protein